MTFASRTVRPRGHSGLGTPSSRVPMAVATDRRLLGHLARIDLVRLLDSCLRAVMRITAGESEVAGLTTGYPHRAEKCFGQRSN